MIFLLFSVLLFPLSPILTLLARTLERVQGMMDVTGSGEVTDWFTVRCKTRSASG